VSPWLLVHRSECHPVSGFASVLPAVPECRIVLIGSVVCR
jgi:hypothetical protein